MFKIFVDNADELGRVSKATSCISWCITPEMRSYATQNKLKNVHVLLLIQADGREMERKLVPFDQGKTYMQYHRGGENIIYGYLVHGHKKSIFSRFGKEDDYSFEPYYRAYDDEDDKSHDIIFDVDKIVEAKPNRTLQDCTAVPIPVENAARVIVDPDLFASELPEWLMFFINLWHEKTLEDQCNLRQRIIFLTFVKIWPILLWTLFMVSARALLYVGAVLAAVPVKSLSFKPVLHPWSEYTNWIFMNVRKRDIFLLHRFPHIGTFPIGILFTPLAGIIYVIAAVCIDVSFPSLSFTHALIMILITLGMSLGIVGFGVCCVMLDRYINRTGFKNTTFGKVILSPFILLGIIAKWVDDFLAVEYDPERHTGQHCPPGDVPQYKAPEKFSFKLLFEQLKASVCKPFPK